MRAGRGCRAVWSLGTLLLVASCAAQPLQWSGNAQAQLLRGQSRRLAQQTSTTEWQLNKSALVRQDRSEPQKSFQVTATTSVTVTAVPSGSMPTLAQHESILRAEMPGHWASGSTPLRLLKCINEHYQHQEMTWSIAMNDTPPSLRAVGAWWSQKPKGEPITIVTQLTVDRLYQLSAQCRSWPGPLSAAVYLAIHQDRLHPLTPRNRHLLQQAVRDVSDFHLGLERDPVACRLDVVLLYELLTDPRAAMLYPINALRNIARLQARTDMVALMDVDMLMSSKMAKHLTYPGNKELMLATCTNHTVYVLPAFETYARNITTAAALADGLAARSKAYLVRTVQLDMAGPFDSKRFAMGHNTTNFTRWYRTSQQYTVDYTYRYEPWVVVHRKLAPWHDVRFRGYGQNKIVHIAHLNASGFQFVVHPQAFIIHRAHPETAARGQLVKDKYEYDRSMLKYGTADTTTVYGHSKKLFDDAMNTMMTKGGAAFMPVLDAATEGCLQILPWWR